MLLVDTNVVSELRKAVPDRYVEKWAAGVPPSDLFLSVIVVEELEKGVLRIERRDQAQGRVLRAWLERQVLPSFADRIIVVDLAVARRAARLQVPDPKPVRDALIAATALAHGMTVVTRNVADFAPTGIAVFNPWADP